MNSTNSPRETCTCAVRLQLRRLGDLDDAQIDALAPPCRYHAEPEPEDRAAILHRLTAHAGNPCDCEPDAWPAGLTFGELSPAQRAAATRRATAQLQAELTANADAIGAAMDAAEAEAAPPTRQQLRDELAANNRAYRTGEISRAEWVTANRALAERGAPLGMTLPPFALTRDDDAEADRRDRAEAEAAYQTADGHPITVGAQLWDNNLEAVEIVALADWRATDREPAWHKTRRLSDGRTDHSDDSRLGYRHPFTRKTVAESL